MEVCLLKDLADCLESRCRLCYCSSSSLRVKASLDCGRVSLLDEVERWLSIILFVSCDWIVMIMLSRKASEIVQRVTCHFKPHSYFIRTAAPLPSILLLLPNRTHHLQSLLNRLTNQTHFSLEQQLSSIQADPSNISNQTQKT